MAVIVDAQLRWIFPRRIPWREACFLVLALYLTGTAAKYPKHIPRFAFDRHASPLNVPLVLNVILVNFGEDAGL
jgi:hypothetical protein